MPHFCIQEKTNGETAQSSHKTGGLAKAHAGSGKTGYAQSRREIQEKKKARKRCRFRSLINQY